MANKRLIDANAVLAEIQKLREIPPKVTSFTALNVIASIKNAPTVDAVEVVRCKDCKHRENLLGEFCCPYYEDLPVDDDHFCAYGERRKE